MISARELRIGNWIFDRTFSTFGDPKLNPIQVDGNLIKSVELEGGKYHSPIPLTPEILQQCGFNKRRDGVYKSLEGTLLTIYLIDGKLTIQCYDWYEEELKHIKHLHQMQNFVHSLTGEELVYQPIKELT